MRKKNDPHTGKFISRKKSAPAKEQPFNSRSWETQVPKWETQLPKWETPEWETLEWDPLPEWDAMEGNVWSDPPNA